MKALATASLAVGLALGGCAETGARSDVEEMTREPDIHYVPTPQPVVEAMLELAKVGANDVLYDLGSGDGRIPITAAKIYGTRGVGIDIDPERISEARRNAREAGVEHLVTFRQEDLFTADIGEASVVTLYLLDTLNMKLRSKLLQDLETGTRVVSHAFSMGDWEPEATQTIDGAKIYKWTVRQNFIPGVD
ncbi:RNA methyltransferase [Novosphingobium endophyticum]|uniref:RNA methyltransferase n=1 Tax=Novosphingobium endophyticum TaxID=1955250 RepID=A0A916X6H9_9SPHN|nr:class I SAM-dependent methyltransferase [Novosphingobium endophyticum]GGC09175.1 RNA methyltransferase [Novosphingobium endophyticum]